MTPTTGGPYRLLLAQRSLASARNNLARAGWRDAALFARAAVEHAAKAIVACFAAVPRTHEPADVLATALAAPGFPADLRATAAALVPALGGFGMKEHVLLSYGDEEHAVDPWTIVDEARARGHVATAEAVVDLARRVVGAVVGGGP